jgi:hypothetical protein
LEGWNGEGEVSLGPSLRYATAFQDHAAWYAQMHELGQYQMLDWSTNVFNWTIQYDAKAGDRGLDIEDFGFQPPFAVTQPAEDANNDA